MVSSGDLLHKPKRAWKRKELEMVLLEWPERCSLTPPPLPQATYKTPRKKCKNVEFVEIWRRSVCRMPDSKILQKVWRKSRSSQKSRRRRRNSASGSGSSKDDDTNTTLFTDGQTGEEDDGMVATLVIICRVAPIPSHNRLLILSASASSFSVEILWSGMSAILHVL